MSAKKSTKKNLFFSIYLSFFTVVLAIYIILLVNTPTAIIEITSRAQTCELLEVFTNTQPEVPLNISNYHRIPVNPNNEFSTYSIIVPLPLRYFRIDPCEKKQQSEISNISIQSQKINQPISLDPGTFTCHSCVLSLQQNSLHITALTNDPIMIVNTIENQISFMNAKANTLFTFIHSIVPFIILLLLLVPFLFVVKKNVFIKFVPLSLLMIVGGFAIKIFNVKAIVKDTIIQARNMFPPPSIGSEHIVGFAQYEGYPLYFEMWLFILFLLTPITLSILLFIYSRYRKKT